MTPISSALADLPALVTAPGGGVAAQHGETARLKLDDARRLFRSGDVLVAHTVFVAGRLKTQPAAPLYDVLELFAFVRPAQPCIPSPLGLARALGLTLPETPDEQALTLGKAAEALLQELRELERNDRLRPIASSLTKMGWKWGPLVLSVVGEPEKQLGPLAG